MRLFLSTLILLSGLCLLSPLNATAIEQITDGSIDRAIEYGLKNQDMGLSFFLDANWIEGQDGTLLNVYTPFMEIARSAVTHKAGPSVADTNDIRKARKKIVEDVHYIYTHPTVKFMCSMYGSEQTFAKGYYADIVGIGRGRKVRLQPSRAIRQNLAKLEEGANFKRYSAINSYHFKYEDIAPLDEIQFRLYGKNLKTYQFNIKSRDLL